MRLVSLCALVFVAVQECSGCARDHAGRPLATRHSVVVDGIEREYLLHVPPDRAAGSPLPLVIALHGGRGTGAQMAVLTGFNQLADRHGFAVAYPYALGVWNDGRSTTEPPGVDDVAFVAALVEDAAARVPLQHDGVFAAGVSNGGMMAQRLACERSDVIRGAAAVIAHLPAPQAGACSPARSVALLLMPGTEDPLMPYEGGVLPHGERGVVLSADATAAFWAERLGCGTEPRIERLPDRAPGDSTRVRREQYACAAGRLERYVVEGGGHTWPGMDPGRPGLSSRLVGRTSQDIDASEVLWSFFQGTLQQDG